MVDHTSFTLRQAQRVADPPRASRAASEIAPALHSHKPAQFRTRVTSAPYRRPGPIGLESKAHEVDAVVRFAVGEHEIPVRRRL